MSQPSEMRTVHIKNLDPCWVEYRLAVEIPADTLPEHVEELVMARIDAGDVNVTYGPDVIGTIDGMDNEYDIIN